MKKQNPSNITNTTQSNQTEITGSVRKSSSIKREQQIKSIILLAITAVSLIIVCLLFFILSKTDTGNNNPPKDYYMDINVGTGQHKIKICAVVNELKIVTDFSIPEGRPYVEVVGETSDIFCFADGTITAIAQNEDKGYTLTIEHIPGMFTIYSNIEPVEDLVVDTQVSCGDFLGIINQTEPIVLQFSIYLENQYIDPTPYLVH